MSLKFFTFTFSFLMAIVSFADMQVHCVGLVGNPSEQSQIDIQIVPFRNSYNEEVYKLYSSLNGQKTEWKINKMPHRDHSGYSFFIPRTYSPLEPTLFMPNEIYVYTDGIHQSSLNYEWKYIENENCQPGYRLVPTLCHPVYAEGGGLKHTSLNCRLRE